MKKVFSFLTLVLMISAQFAQAQMLSNEYLGCNSFITTFDGTIRQNLFTASTSVICQPNNVTRVIAGASVSGAQYQLQQMNGSGTFVTVNTTESNANSRTYSNLGAGIYRVRILVRVGTSTPVFPFTNPCTNLIAGFVAAPSGGTVIFSDEIEVGTPTISNIIFPAPTGTPPSISYSKIDAPNELLLLNGEACFGERAFQVAVFKNVTTTGVEVGYASTGWIQGKISIFDLKSLNMVYEPGYTYTVQLALSQLPCTGWLDQTKTFRVTVPRETEEETTIALRPNPVSDLLHIDGLDAWETEKVDVAISDMLGRQVLSTTLTAPFEPVSVADLTPGNYVLILRTEDKTLTKKIVVQR